MGNVSLDLGFIKKLRKFFQRNFFVFFLFFLSLHLQLIFSRKHNYTEHTSRFLFESDVNKLFSGAVNKETTRQYWKHKYKLMLET